MAALEEIIGEAWASSPISIGATITQETPETILKITEVVQIETFSKRTIITMLEVDSITKTQTIKASKDLEMGDEDEEDSLIWSEKLYD